MNMIAKEIIRNHTFWKTLEILGHPFPAPWTSIAWTPKGLSTASRLERDFP